MSVLNAFPSDCPVPSRIAIVGQSPGDVETETGKPFQGPSGALLNAVLGPVGIVRDWCFIGNVCQHQPPRNDFAMFEWGGAEIQGGIAQLQADLAKFKPTLVLCLGNEALHLLKEGNVAPARHKTKTGFAYKWPNPISDWRGSLFWSSWAEVKCVATYHPAAVLRDFGLQPYIKFDIRRAAQEAKTPELLLTERSIYVAESVAHALDTMEEMRKHKRVIVMDIEGGVSSMTCFGIADSSERAMVVPLCRADGSPRWDVVDETNVLLAFQRLMEDETVPKVLQNYLYDAFVLAWTYGITINGLVGDTMLQWHELYCELEKALGVQASVLTREPFWKADRKSEDDMTAWRYCGKDCCVTYECWERMTEMLSKDKLSLGHYHKNLASLAPLLYMELRGMKYDKQGARAALREVERQQWIEQHWVNQAARGGRPQLNELYNALGL